MASFIKTINQSNFILSNLPSGLVSSDNIFNGIAPSPLSGNLMTGDLIGFYTPLTNQPGPLSIGNTLFSVDNARTAVPILNFGQTTHVVFVNNFNAGNFSTILYNIGNLVFNRSSVVLNNSSSYFVEKTIAITASQQSKLKMYLNFNTSQFQTISYNTGPTTYRLTTGTWFKLNQNLVLVPTLNSPSRICFRILANNVGIYNLQNSFVGNIEVMIPAGTTTIKFETYDAAYPSGVPQYYSRNSNYFIRYNNLRINIDNLPSRPISSTTLVGTGYTYLNYVRSSSLSVSDIDTNGYHNIVLGQSELDRPVPYFVVGDDWKDPNFRPLNTNRNLCLEFPNIDFTDIDEDERIELVLNVVDINTDEAEEQYDHLGIPKPVTKEFYQFGDNAEDTIGEPNKRRARMDCSVARSDFVETIPLISAGPNNHTVAIDVPIKGGILIYNITDAVKASLVAGREKIVVWLTYDEGTRDKYVTFRISNTERNKPRIRFKLK